MADTTMNMDSNGNFVPQSSANSDVSTIKREAEPGNPSITTSTTGGLVQPNMVVDNHTSSTRHVTSQPDSNIDNATTFIKSELTSSEAMSSFFSSQSASPHTPIHTHNTMPTEVSSNAVTSQSINTSVPLEFLHLQKVIAEASPIELENSIEIAAAALNNVNSHLLTVINNPHAARCLKLIEEANNSYKPPRTVIGVIGETGAGKSSLINALLGEEKVVPTNCMRACTAVSTEISWNEAIQPEEQFRAEIEFITPEEWLAELIHLFKDMTDGSGEVVINTNKETDAGVAWAKIQSVYPSLDKDKLSKTSAKGLSRHISTQEILGTTKKLNAPSASALYKLIQRYIDSKDNSSSESKNSGPSVLWPLIKVVRIYLKSEILSTGAVLVDLPGVGDSNAARASVADKYLEKCDSIWIVAPIIRAVDNKTAQHLLGDTFKLQMKFDGGFSNISFICSRTDEVSVDEVVESLNLNKDYEIARASTDRNSKEIQTLEAKVEDLDATGNEKLESRTQIEKQIATWQRLCTRQAKGLQVYAPSPITRKRKSTAGHPQSTKRRQSRRPKFYNISDEEDEVGEEVCDGEPLTAQQIEAMLAKLDDEKANINEELRAIEEKVENVQNELDDLQVENKSSKHKILSLCIAERNEFSRRAIQSHFALGIRNLDEDTAMKNDAENFDPDHKIRDYEEIARALPVFCVSSRAYQSQMGRVRSENKVEGFTLEMTEIPQLLAHAQQITETRRTANCKRFLNCSLLVFQTLKTWLEDKDSEIKISVGEAEAETQKVKQELCELRKMLDEAANRSVNQFSTILEKKIFRNIATAAKKASIGVMAIVDGWGRPVIEGGYYHSTYKAACVRDGTYSRKNIDFNQDLIKPFKQQLANTWESTFSDAVPKMLDEFQQATEQAMEAFHGKTLSRLEHEGLACRIKDLRPQLTAYTQAMKDSQVDFGRSIQDWQREANREITPGVKEVMKSAYYQCAEQTGTGSFNRMKKIMHEHANNLQKRQNVFTKSTREVRKGLDKMLDEYREALPERITTTIGHISLDYLEAIQQAEDTGAPEETRHAIIDILSRLDADFNFAGTI